MRIYNNLMAMNSYRQLSNNSNQAGKVLEKLSSGQRINRASDDAAGASMSEKMRGQIRGLNQADRNIRDAISLIETAEGGLNETHSILQRIRELSVQASNDTCTFGDRNAIQAEIDQMVKEVDRIGNDTEFNTKKLLNQGSASTVPTTTTDQDAIISSLKKWWLEEAENLVASSYGLSTSGINMTVEVINDPGSTYAAYVQASFTSVPGDTVGGLNITGMGSNLTLRVNLAYSLPSDTIDGGTYPQYVDRVIAHEMTHAVMMTTMNFGDLPIWFNEGAAEFTHGADERLKNSIYLLGGSSLNPANLDAGVANVVSNIGSGSDLDWSGDSNDYSTAYLAVRYLDKMISSTGGNAGTASNSDGIKAVMTYLSNNPTQNLNDALASLNASGLIGFSNTAGWVAAVKADINSVADLSTYANVSLDFSVTGTSFTPEADTGSVIGLDSNGGGSAYTAESIMPEAAGAGAAEDENPTGFNIAWTQTTALVADTFIMQIGANSGQKLEIQTSDMRAQALGIGGLKVTSHGLANSAISSCDSAIEMVSTVRARFGAYQNRLEHADKFMSLAAENLSAAESRIRDADMAKEMMAFTKENILMQSAQAMLAQANRLPQSVLDLLG
ncbi:flagellinolysin [Eubacteriaceae bacterium ES2]|nr:flagellinolysin [Eubacteriaceae bacterium ES2]